jgi:hypothetical protein
MTKKGKYFFRDISPGTYNKHEVIPATRVCFCCGKYVEPFNIFCDPCYAKNNQRRTNN